MKTLANERLGTDPVGRLLFRLAAPSIVAMVMQAVYNAVDSIYVAKISSASFAAVTLAFPIQMITGALSTGIGVGINSCISRSFGSGNPKKASTAAANGLELGLISLLIMVLFGLFGTRAFYGIYTKDAEVISAGVTYARTICLLSFGTIFTQISFSILQGSGSMLFPMISQIAGCITVLCLDPLFILVLKLGVAGAALASSSAQIVGMLIGLYGVFVTNRKNLPISKSDFIPDGAVVKDILSVGIPSALTQATTSVVSGILNKIIAVYGTSAITIYGGYTKFSSFGTLPVFGVTRGMTPILGYSYGAKDRKRFLETRRLATLVATAITAISALVFILFPNLILNLINASEEIRQTGRQAYRILGFSLFITGASVSINQVFPPAKRSYLTMISTLLRQVGFLLPFCMLGSRLMGLVGVWTGLVATDYVAMAVTVGMYIWFKRKVIDSWDKTPQDNNENAIQEADK